VCLVLRNNGASLRRDAARRLSTLTAGDDWSVRRPLAGTPPSGGHRAAAAAGAPGAVAVPRRSRIWSVCHRHHYRTVLFPPRRATGPSRPRRGRSCGPFPPRPRPRRRCRAAASRAGGGGGSPRRRLPVGGVAARVSGPGAPLPARAPLPPRAPLPTPLPPPAPSSGVSSWMVDGGGWVVPSPPLPSTSGRRAGQPPAPPLPRVVPPSREVVRAGIELFPIQLTNPVQPIASTPRRGGDPPPLSRQGNGWHISRTGLCAAAATVTARGTC